MIDPFNKMLFLLLYCLLDYIAKETPSNPVIGSQIKFDVEQNCYQISVTLMVLSFHHLENNTISGQNAVKAHLCWRTRGERCDPRDDQLTTESDD